MSLYKRGDSPFYHYDFRCQGHRFHGSTGCRKKSEAQEFERRRKLEAPALIAKQASAGRSGDMTLDIAAGRFWLERGQFYRGNARATFKRSLAWLVAAAGPDRKLSQIGNALVAELVAKRRGQGPLLPAKNMRSKKRVSNATVNRTVTEPLRRILRRAKEAWDEPIGKVSWKDHMLPEPKERVRELRDHEEERLLDQMRADYLPAIRFMLASGCRLAETVNLRWSDIDWGSRTIALVGKGEKADTIPLSSELRDILWPLQNHHPDVVFTYTARRTRHIRKTDRRIEKGELYPITYEGLKTAWRRHGAPAAKIADFRLHDIRHTTASRLLRDSRNLKLVQKLLRHEDIATTVKYAHVDDNDLRKAMDVLSKSRDKSRVADEDGGESQAG